MAPVAKLPNPCQTAAVTGSGAETRHIVNHITKNLGGGGGGGGGGGHGRCGYGWAGVVGGATAGRVREGGTPPAQLGGMGERCNPPPPGPPPSGVWGSAPEALRFGIKNPIAFITMRFN